MSRLSGSFVARVHVGRNILVYALFATMKIEAGRHFESLTRDATFLCHLFFPSFFLEILLYGCIKLRIIIRLFTVDIVAIQLHTKDIETY